MHCFSSCKKLNGRNWLCVGLTLNCIDRQNFKEVPVDFNCITREDISLIVLACWNSRCVFVQFTLYNFLASFSLIVKCTTISLPELQPCSDEDCPFWTALYMSWRFHCEATMNNLGQMVLVHNRPLTVSIWANCQFCKALSLSQRKKESTLSHLY